ncbi:MAG: response regulator [Thermodesulfobacteriota bacterium]
MDENKVSILAVEDSQFALKFLLRCLAQESSFVVTQAGDGEEALNIIQTKPPDLVITDWSMPKMDGPELCRRVRAMNTEDYIYIILLSSMTSSEDIVIGLSAGADDYVIKPFKQEELMARVKAGVRVVRTQKALTRSNQELKAALAHIKTLRGLLPICMDCKKIRNDKDYWQEVDHYLTQTMEAEFTHSLCPDCMNKRMAEIDAKKPKGSVPPGRGVQS